MSFGFIGAGGAGSGGALWKYSEKSFTNTEPDSTKFFDIWESGNPALPEPDTVHIFMIGGRAWTRASETRDTLKVLPPCCGAAFGYKKFYKGNIPQKLYAWRGRHQEEYPYTYPKDRTFGFNTEPTRDGAYLLPNMGGKHMFPQTDFIPADAKNNHYGDWDVVFNGGKGHYWEWQGIGEPDHDGMGSNGSVFGDGYDGSEYPAGSGSDGLVGARGTAANLMDSKILKEWGPTQRLISGDDPTDNLIGTSGKAKFAVPANIFAVAAAPFAINGNDIKLPSPDAPLRRTDKSGSNLTFVVLQEWRT